MTTTTTSTATTVPSAAPLRTLSEFPQPFYGASEMNRKDSGKIGESARKNSGYVKLMSSDVMLMWI